MKGKAWALAAGAALAACGALAVGPAAALIVDWAGDGRKVWRLGVLQLDGVAGAHLGDLRARRLTLRDADGVWAEARDVRLAWAPMRLLSGEVRIAAAEIEALSVLRRPKLGPAPPRGEAPDIDLRAGQIGRLTLADGVAGAAKTYTLDLSLRTGDSGLEALDVALAGLEDAPDQAALRLRRFPRLELSGTLVGPAGGALAAWLGAPLTGAIAAAGGAGKLTLESEETLAATMDFAWSTDGWRGDGWIETSAWPALRAFGDRFGPRLAFEAASQAPFAQAGPFTAALEARSISARLEGRFADDFALEGPARATIRADHRALARDAGAARFDGVLDRQGKAFTLKGGLALERLEEAAVTLSGSGAFTVRLDPQELRVGFTGADMHVTGADIVERLLADPEIAVIVAHDRRGGGARFTKLSVEGAGLSVEGAGPVDALKGRWRLRDAGALFKGARGRGAGVWNLTDAEGLRLTLEGRGEGLADVPAPLADGWGSAPKIAAALQFSADAVTLDRAVIEGQRLRLGVAGPIRNARADLAWEASWRGPLSAYGLTIAGAGDAIGTARGPLDGLVVTGQARTGVLDIAGAVVENAVVDARLSLLNGGARGEASLGGRLFDQPLRGQAQLNVSAAGAVFDGAMVRLGPAIAQGAARFDDAGATIEAGLSGSVEGLWPGAAGALNGRARVTPGADGAALIDAEAEIGRGAIAPGAPVRRATATLAGPLERPDFTYAVSGETAAAFAFEGRGQADFAEGLEARFTAEGRINGAPLATARPGVVAFTADGARADVALSVGGGALSVLWDARKTGRVRLAATAQDAPLALAAVFGGEKIAGAISGSAELSGEGAALTGRAEAALRGLGLSRRAGDPVDADAALTLSGGRLSGTLSARSASGLSARIGGAVPVAASAEPLRIVRNPEQSGRLEWSVRGPVDGLWDLFGPLDQTLTGEAQGEGVLIVGPRQLSGEGRLALKGGAFEDKVSGARLTEIAALLTADEKGLRLQELSARDGNGGRLTGEGAIGADGTGRIDLTLADMRLIDRPDARARGGGKLALIWTQGGATLSGDLRLIEAEASPPRIDAPAPPTIAVTEVNRPGADENGPEPEPRPADGLPVRLNVRVTADDRVFTRGRGLEAEWALDLRVEGALEAPKLYGEARLLRGAFTLAGRPFDLQSGVIRFDGAPETAEINLAAVAETPDLTATVTVAGDFNAPEVSFRSTPALPEDEILPRILFSRSAAELSPLEAAQLAASLAALSGVGAFDVAAAARAAIDLDRLDLRSGDAGQILLTGGKYITREVYLEVSRTADGATATSVEWQVRPRLFLISSFLPQGDHRIAVRWRKDYEQAPGGRAGD